MNTLSKINQEIKDLCEHLNGLMEIQKGENQSTRDGYVCANIRTYKWIDEDDVVSIALNQRVPQERIEDLKEEFSEDRLYDIERHCNEWEVECFKDNEYSNMRETLKYYREIAKKRKLDKEEKKVVRYGEAIELLELDEDDIKWLGRSGGWLGFIEDGDLFEWNQTSETAFAHNLFWEVKSDNVTNSEFNELYNHERDNWFNGIEKTPTKRQVVKFLENEIQYWNDYINAIDTVVDHIEGLAKGMNEVYLERLSDEISEWMEQEDVLADVENLTLTENQIAWIEGKTETANGFLTLAKKKDDENLITSQRVTLPIKQVKLLHEKLKAMSIDKDQVVKLGWNLKGYTIERAKNIGNDILIKAGCHNMLLSNFTRLI